MGKREKVQEHRDAMKAAAKDGMKALRSGDEQGYQRAHNTIRAHNSARDELEHRGRR